MRFLVIAAILTIPVAAQSKPTAPKPDETDPKNPVWDLRVKKNENARFFQIGPAKDDREPKDGYGLLLVLPGGDGSPDFMPWCRNIRANVLRGRLDPRRAGLHEVEDEREHLADEALAGPEDGVHD